MILVTLVALSRLEAGPKDFRVMAAGQPGAGGIVASGRGGGGGGGGEVLDVEISFTAGVYPVTANAVNGVSARGAVLEHRDGVSPMRVQGGASGNGNPGGGQSADGWSAGGGGGSGGAGANSGGNQCAGGGRGTVTNISGYNQVLGTGGGGGAQNNAVWRSSRKSSDCLPDRREHYCSNQGCPDS